MRDIRKDVAEKFPQDVQNHTLSVELDNGLHRHLLFMQNGSGNYHFHLTTWPGYLCISGDMGCYVFSRLSDMFEFFRTDKGEINPGYWGQKVEGSKGDVTEFSEALFKDAIREDIEPWLYENSHQLNKEMIAELWERIRDEIFSELDNGPQSAYRAAMDFTIDVPWYPRPYYLFADFWEQRCEHYTYRFLWCCHAILWGIQQYDALKTQQQEATENATPILPVP